MPTINVSPSTLAIMLERAQDGDEFVLDPGEYPGPFAVTKAVTLKGAALNATIWTGDEPAIVINAPGVVLENLTIERNVGWEMEAVVAAAPGASPRLKGVALKGQAPEAVWDGMAWDLPDANLGTIKQGENLVAHLKLQVGMPCQVRCDQSWLRLGAARLSPGPQTLQVQVDITSDMLPGTQLMAAVELVPSAAGELQTFYVMAEVASAQPRSEAPVAPLAHDRGPILSETWRFIMTRKAAETFLAHFKGPTKVDEDWHDDLYGDQVDPRDEAQGLFLTLFGGSERTWYVRRKEANQPGEEFWQLSLACDVPEQELPEVLKKQAKTLCMFAALNADGQGSIKFITANLRFQDDGHADGYSYPVSVRWLPQSYGDRGRVSPEVMAGVRALPYVGSVKPTAEQRRMWEAFLKAEERIAQQRQFCVPFDESNRATAGRVVSLRLDPQRALLGPGMPSIEADELWRRLKKARNQSVQFFQTLPTDPDRRGMELGTIESWKEDEDLIRVRLSEDLLDRQERGLWSLSGDGWIVFTAFGDLAQIKRKQQGMKFLEQGKVQNVFLAEFLFDPTQAREPQELVTLRREDLLNPSRLNEGQKLAVEKALSVPDLMLVQGPPGTGKTTVIAEICYQIALRGGRTLIASQSNLAVDNALSRLVANPTIRALRKGRADKVEEEGLPYLEDNVISTWLSGTASNCEQEMRQRDENIRLFRDLLGNSARFTTYLEHEEAFLADSQSAHARKAELAAAAHSLEVGVASLQEAQAGRERMSAALDAFIQRLDILDLDDPRVDQFLKSLQSLIATDIPCQDYVRRYQDALAAASTLGLVPPQAGVLRGATWLRNHAPRSHEAAMRWLQEAQAGLDGLVSAQQQQAALQDVDAELAQLTTELQLKQSQVSQTRQGLGASQAGLQQLTALFPDIENSRTSLPTNVTAAFKRAVETSSPGSIVARAMLTAVLPSWPHEAAWFTTIVQHVQGQLEGCQAGLQQIIGRRAQTVQDHQNAKELFASLLRDIPSDVRTQAQPGSMVGTGAYARATSARDLTAMATEIKSQLKAAFHQKKLLGLIPLGGRWDVSEVAEVLTQLRQAENRLTELGEAEQRLRQDEDRQLGVRGLDITAKVSGLLEAGLRQAITDAQATEVQLRTQAGALDAEVANTQQRIHLKTADRQQRHHTSIVLRDQSLQVLRALASSVPAALNEEFERLMRFEVAPATFSELASMHLASWQRLVDTLDSLDPRFLLDRARHNLMEELNTAGTELQAANAGLAAAHAELAAAEAALMPSSVLAAERTWWVDAWAAIPARLQPSVPAEGLHSPIFLRRVNALFDAWQRELEREERHMGRYRQLVTDWALRLRQPTEQDESELRQLYLDNANVIGITCNQAAARDFSETFKNFDAIIVDEVSKATPPELVLPALKGKKVILIGDHKQLPPMLDTTTISELAEELKMPEEDVEFLKISLFKQLFERAPEGIKQMLNTQYRMHPSIMNAINQFYSHRLECGLTNPDEMRAHGLDSPNFPAERHLAWIPMPLAPGFYEEQEGNSFVNRKEVAVIEKLLDELEAAWAPKIELGQKPKEIAIITFYLPQLKLLRDTIGNGKAYPSLSIRLGTVDRFQGMEREIVIVSTVRNNTHGTIGFAKEPERINVAFSRAQQLLVVVGCHELFQKYRGAGNSPYINVTNAVRQAGGFLDVSRFLV